MRPKRSSRWTSNPGGKPGRDSRSRARAPSNPGIRVEPADLAVVIDEKPHALFKRDGDDLVYHCAITLRQALCGFKLTFRGVDGEDVVAQPATGEVTSPGAAVRVKGRGMPSRKRPGGRGDVIVKVDRVDFPKRTTEAQRAGFKELLSGAK